MNGLRFGFGRKLPVMLGTEANPTPDTSILMAQHAYFRLDADADS